MCVLIYQGDEQFGLPVNMRERVRSKWRHMAFDSTCCWSVSKITFIERFMETGKLDLSPERGKYSAFTLKEGC